MKSVGILTFHHGHNYGGFLQVYSLYKYLSSLGHNVKIINYFNPIDEKNKFRMTYLNRNIFNLPVHIRRKKIFDNFLLMLPTTDKVCSIEEVEENFDTVVLGSDEVWNFYNPMFGKDLSYFGQGVKSSKIISYAASFGTRTPEYGIDEDVKEAIKKIDSISVRDINSNEMIESIGLNVEIVADPTFLIDQKDHLVDIKTNEDYLLFYGFMLHEGDIRLIKDFARENNLKIISVGYKNRWCDLNILDANPFEWNTYVHNAKYVVTTMFHGLVYSIIHEKQFVFVMNDYRRYKVGYLMKYLKLDSSTYYHENDNIIDKMLSHIDYKFINSNLNELIANSKEFLIREI